MNLFAETANALGGVTRILRQFMRVVPGITLTLAVNLTLARITRLLAFLLPVKVILLAGSEGIPRYFRFFLSPEHRTEGIIVLSIAAVVSYALTLFLETRSARLADRGGADLLSAAGVMSLVDNQRAEMQGVYTRFMQVASGALFVVTALVVLLLLNPVLGAYIVALCSGAYLLTAWALHGTTPLRRNRLADLIEHRLGGYLGFVSSVALLSGFLIIIYPFLAGTNGNILIAIVSFVLLRRLASELTSAVKDTIALTQKRQLVETLVLPDRQFQQGEVASQRTLRELFGRQDREKLFADNLGDLRQAGGDMRVAWIDPPVRGMAEFSIALHEPEGGVRHLRQRAFSPRLRRLVENEDLLFRHIDRQAVWAAPVVTRFMHSDYECIVYDAGSGEVPTAQALAQAYASFLAALWCAELPPALVRIYSATHRSLHERLGDDVVARMDVAVGTDAEATTLARLRSALPALRERIGDLPRCLTHPAFTPGETVLGRDGAILVVGGWGRWTLEPMGALLPPSLASDNAMTALLEEVRRRRPDLAENLEASQLVLARQAQMLERAIAGGAMKSGLVIAQRLLDGSDGEAPPDTDEEADGEVEADAAPAREYSE